MNDIDLKAKRHFDLFISSASTEARACLLESIQVPAGHHWMLDEGSIESTDPAQPSAESRPISVERTAFGSQLKEWVRRFADSVPTILVDVSCISRPGLAAVFEAICTIAEAQSLNLEVGYSVAEFTPPAINLLANEDIAPISTWFSGWPIDAGTTTALVLGLGYERYKAEGACEFFDASENWVFLPHSPVIAYDDAVGSNNRDLLARTERKSRTVGYRVDRPSQTFGQLAATVSAIARYANPVLLPFGPKIFFAINLLVAALYREAGVWHVTGDVGLSGANELPSKYLIGFRAELEPA